MLQGQFGKYRIELPVGVGGMSVVYRAVDETTNHVVAIKILNAEWAANPVGQRRFEREAQIARQLDHPNIITVYEDGVIDNHAYLAMEYMARGSLARYFANPVPMTLGESAQWLKSIASALDYAHSKGVIHRDLKLENVLLDDAGRVILSDFGIARMETFSTLTETGQSFGTPLYLSPEQVRGAKYVDYRTDIYSLAVIAFLLATGYFPFSAMTGAGILHQHLMNEPPFPSNLNPRLPPDMNWVLLKGLAKQPEDRYASAGALARDFEAASTRFASVEIVILTTQPTPILSAVDDFEDKPNWRPGGADTRLVNNNDLNRTPLPYQSGKSVASSGVFRGLLVIAIIGVLLFGFARVLQAPDETPTLPPATSNAALIGTQTTTSPTVTQTETLLPTNTARPSLTPAPITPTSMAATLTQQAISASSEGTPPPVFLLETGAASATRTITSATAIRSTTVPASNATSTSVPATQVFPTNPPPTSVPATHVPPTNPPPTSVPATPVPPTSIPPTHPPPTSVPPTNPPLLPLPTIPLLQTLLPGL